MGNCILTRTKKELITLLWQNPSTTSAFAPQTIDLDLKDCKLVCVEFKSASNYTDEKLIYTQVLAVVNGGITQANWVVHLDTLYAYCRRFTPTTTGIQFGSGYSEYSSGETISNTIQIPTCIYGLY